MNTIPRRGANVRLSGDLATVVVAIAAYISVLPAPPPLFTLADAILMGGLIVVYVVVGTRGLTLCQRARSPRATAAYFTIQLLLGAAILYLGQAYGFISMILFPLAGHAVTLASRGWLLVLCALIGAVFAGSIALTSSWENALRAIPIYLSGVVMVVLFTYITVRAERDRDEVNRLAAELGEANHKLREYAAQVEELATTRERNRLAREIHDSLGHYLTVINVQIEAARTVIESDRSRALDSLAKAQTLTKEGLAEVRRSVSALRAAPTDGRPLPEVVAALVDECRAAGIRAEIAVAGDPRSLTPQAALTLYRAAQEGLTNVRRHAHASRADLTLDYRDDARVRLTVRDNGVGTSAANSGFGLVGIRERAQLLGGQVRIHTAAGQGFTLEVEVPG